MKYVTIKDVAKEAGFSVSTVSRALNGDVSIRKETRQLIKAKAEEMGYQKNPVAMNLKFGYSHTIGVIVPEMNTPYAATVIDGIQDICDREKYKVLVASSGESAEKESRNLDMMFQFMVDGIIACQCDCRFNTDRWKEASANLPIVMYDRINPDLSVPKVVVDDETKAYLLVEHLIRSGRKRIAFIGVDPSRVYNSHLRMKGYQLALSRYHLEVPASFVMMAEGMKCSDGAAAMDKLLSLQPDAVFAFTDTLAIGAMNRLTSLGYDVPKDVAVAGFSGTPLGTITRPMLTTVEPHQFAMGQEAAKLLLKIIGDRKEETEHTYDNVIVEADMVYRQSTE
jgi:LacI family transcriptional regulator